ncbi:MAG: hypothetical protein ACOX68_07515 [Candidatus Limivicinus sp.]|jgi:hypothetical protein
MLKNLNIRPRRLTEKEREDRKAEIYDTFANYLTFCPECGYMDKTNMYLMRAESRLKKIQDSKLVCPGCGKCAWELGYPDGTETGFVKLRTGREGEK